LLLRIKYPFVLTPEQTYSKRFGDRYRGERLKGRIIDARIMGEHRIVMRITGNKNGFARLKDVTTETDASAEPNAVVILRCSSARPEYQTVPFS
jgi:hypothetical protein